MEYKILQIIKEKKLVVIAERYNTSIAEIKEANPNLKTFKTPEDDEYLVSMQAIRIPQKKIMVHNESEKEIILKGLIFEKASRYRCSQINLTKALDVISFSSDIKTQYLVSNAGVNEKYYHTIIEDYIYQISPKGLEAFFELVKPIEQLKNNIIFTQNNLAEFDKILNFNQIEQSWVQFREKRILEIDFFKQLKNQSEESADNFIKTANTEFSNELIFKENLNKNLFYHILLKANIGSDLENYTLTQDSQIFPSQELTINVTKTQVSEDENTLVFKLVGELQKNKLSEDELRKLYEENYQPLLKYSFTEFEFTYRITYTLDAKTALLINAKASLNEKVKNNFETITEFELNRVEL